MIYVTVILCAFFLARLVYRYDMYEREPWYMLLLCLAGGFFGCWGIGYAEDWMLFHWFPDHGTQVGSQATVAALAEEAIKLSVVLLIAFCFRGHFNDPIDGLIYGAFSGLGFAIYESWMYIDLMLQMSGGPTMIELFGQEAIRLALHMLTGSFNGFGFGLARFRIKHWPWILPTWIFSSVTVHFLWDYSCGLPAADESSVLLQRGMAVGLMIFSTILFGIAVSVGVAWSRVIHPPPDNHPHRLVGWPFSLFIKNKRS